MEAEYVIFKSVQRTAADEAKVGQVLLVLTPIGHAIVLAVPEFEIDAAQMLFLGRQIAEATIASPKNSPEDAITRNLPIVTARAQSVTMAMRACGFGKRNCV